MLLVLFSERIAALKRMIHLINSARFRKSLFRSLPVLGLYLKLLTFPKKNFYFIAKEVPSCPEQVVLLIDFL